MLGEKAKSVRRNLRALRRVKGDTRSTAPRHDYALPLRRGAGLNGPRVLGKGATNACAVASVCSAVAAGFDLCARRTRDETIAVASRNAAEFLRTLFESTIETAAKHGIDARPRTRTGDRLRWEWLASTATVVDGSPDSRLLFECARILGDAVASNPTGLGADIDARLRAASAEAYSLALAAQYERRRESLSRSFETITPSVAIW